MNILKTLATHYETMIAADEKAKTMSQQINAHDRQRQALVDELNQAREAVRTARMSIDEMLVDPKP